MFNATPSLLDHHRPTLGMNNGPLRYSAPQRAFPQFCLHRYRLAAPARALVMALLCLVHCLPPLIPGAFAQGPRPEPADGSTLKPGKNSATSIPRTPLEKLPLPVQEMRDAILNAAARGDIEELRTAIEWNELTPEFGLPSNSEAIEHWRKSSHDGSGREILAVLTNILSAAPAKLPIGPDLENNDVFVWPYLSEIPPKELSPSQQVELFRIAPTQEAAAMISRGKWTWYRLAIAADGTWHIFSKNAAINSAEKLKP